MSGQTGNDGLASRVSGRARESPRAESCLGRVMQDRLSRFIDDALEKGMDHPTLFFLLKSGGWRDKEIAEALAARALGMSVPQRAGIGSPRDAFFHLLAFTAMYAWVISLLYLLFTYIDFAFPDPARRVQAYEIDWALSGIRASLAALIVSFPIFLMAWGYLLREIRASPEKAQSGVRRWLAFLSLFVAAVTIIANVITVVYYLVEGDLTVRFVLKVLIMLVVTGGVFSYLSLTLRSEAEAKE